MKENIEGEEMIWENKRMMGSNEKRKIMMMI